MFGAGRSEYDKGLTTFSPEGRLYQVEYALAAIKIGATAIGISTPHGVVLAVEKRLTSPLVESSSVEKIMKIDEHIGCAMSGLSADARTLVDSARNESQNHRFTFDEPIYPESLVHSIADQALDFSEKKKKKMARPMGVALLVAGFDCKTGNCGLFKTDPSGNYYRCKAVAIGAAAESATNALVEQYKEDLTFETAEKMAIEILKQGMEEKMGSKNIEVACVRKEDGKFRVYSTSEVESLIKQLA
jgi:20S proteasome subunit alpha 5